MLLNNNNLLEKYSSNLDDLVNESSEDILEKCNVIVNNSKLSSDKNITESQANKIKKDINKISNTITDISNNLVSNIEESKTILSDIIKNIN